MMIQVLRKEIVNLKEEIEYEKDTNCELKH